MKFLRFGPPGQEKPGMLDAEGGIRDLSGVIGDIDGSFLAGPDLAKVMAMDPASLPKADGAPRIGPCVGSIPKFICVGLNFTDHAEETGQPMPSHPLIFAKATSAVSGPNDDVVIPRGSEKTDWEVELALVIGKRASYVEEAEAMDYVAGYCIANDVSERSYQFDYAGQWTKGKSCDTFGPLGPWLVTKDEIADPQALGMYCAVNGHKYQNGSSSTMFFKAAHLVSHISEFMTLEPGDIISTGTPPGVGAGQNPQVFLKPGDVMELGIDGLGVQRQTCVAWTR